MKLSVSFGSSVPLASLAAALALFLFSGTAHAIELGTPAQKTPFHSAQNFALELRIAPYHPQVDDEPDLHGATPYADSFGDKPRFYIGIEFDWEALRIPLLGTIGPGVGIGRVGAGRNVLTVSGRQSADETDLTIVPMYAVAVLRADIFFRQFNFPLIPYAKFGIASGLWRASNSSGTASDGNVSGKGISWGTHASVGAAFVLDSLDRGASRNMDNATGINTTALFFELTNFALNGINQDHALHVGSTNWTTGITFEF